MKIVVLDGYTLNPGDLGWDALGGLGDLTVYERSLPAEVVDRAAGAEVVLTNKVEFNDALFAQLPGLRYVGVTATGFNIVDTGAARLQHPFGIPDGFCPVAGNDPAGRSS
jgi:glycerate dehydrogenase